MRRNLLLSMLLIPFVIGGCPPLLSIYNVNKVNCPKCSFLPAKEVLKLVGAKGILSCPKGYELWFYNEKEEEFVAPSTAIKSNQLNCKNNKWVLSPSGKDVILSAIACAKE